MSLRVTKTLGEFVTLQRGHDLTEPDRRPGLVPVMGSAGQNGTHDKSRAAGPGVVIGRSGASFGQPTDILGSRVFRIGGRLTF